MLTAYAMKVKETREWDIPDLGQRLKGFAERSEKSVAQICRDAGISTTFWYDVARGARVTMKKSTLDSLCKALGITPKDVGIDDE